MPNPLDDAPVLWPCNEPVWDAYQELLLWADGNGGMSPDVLERWLTAPHPGSRLDARTRRDVRRDVPHLLREDRRLQAEEWKRRQREIDRRLGRHRHGGTH